MPRSYVLVLLGVLLALSCGGGEESAQPAPGLPLSTLNPEAHVNPAGIEPPPMIESTAAGDPLASFRPRAENTLTFARDIAPIVYDNCAVCHRPDGSAPFALTSFDDVRKRARQIATVTQQRYMPPWLPAHGYNEFEGERRLTKEQIGMIDQWVREGMRPGDLSQAPPTPEFASGWQLGEPDFVVELTEPYTLRADGPDDFRNFVIPDVLAEDAYIRGFEFDPGDAPQVVHHVEIRLDETTGSLARDQQDPDPGFHGMDADTAHYPRGHFLAWVPGKSPKFEPDGRAWELARGDDLVVQLHMLPSGREETVNPQIALYRTDVPPSPVSPMMLRLGSKTLDIPAGQTSYEIRDTFEVPVDIEVLEVLPHAHYVAKDMQAFATFPDGKKIWLLRIDDWDFNWQDSFRYREPIQLPKGTIIGMRYTYDNSADNERNPNNPPERIAYGPRSSDEMGDLWLRIAASSAYEMKLLRKQVAQHKFLQDVASYSALIRANPLEPSYYSHLGVSYLKAQKLDEGIAALQEAVRLAPDDFFAHELLGLTMRRKGDLQAAADHLQKAAALAPTHPQVQFNLAMVLTTADRKLEAIEPLERAAELQPDDALTRAHLARIYSETGRFDQAERAYRRVLELDADSIAALDGLARLMATHPEQSRRDPAQALEHARRAEEITGGRDVEILRSLAAAHAASGDFERAVQIARRAAKRAREQQSPSLAAAVADVATLTAGEQIDFYGTLSPGVDQGGS